MIPYLFKVLAGVVAVSFTGAAFAHPGTHVYGMAEGLLHPLFGLDHLLAAFAVGAWATTLEKEARWIVPACFIVAMLFAAGVAMLLNVPTKEAGIAATLLAIGCLIAFAVRLRTVYASLAVGVFAVFHGAAHAMEMPANTGAWAYFAGFGVTTAVLHLLGLGVGSVLQRYRWSSQAFGSLLIVSGGWMLSAL